MRDPRPPADYDAAGVRVIGISPDTVEAQAKFAGKFDLDFTLLADADHAVADAYGAWVEKKNYGKTYWGVQRATFIIDPEGEIAHVFPKARRRRTTTRCSRAALELRPERDVDDEGREQPDQIAIGSGSKRPRRRSAQ